MPNSTVHPLAPQSAFLHPAAFVALQRCWHVFPVLNDPTLKKKIPAFSARSTNGKRWGASDDPAFITKLFARHYARHGTEAHIGVACGPESGMWVMDIDTVKGHGAGNDGHASLAALVANYGPLPTTLTSISPSGGEHYHFRYPTDGRKVVSRKLLDERGNKIEGIDVKGEGGYVVTVPSKGRAWRDGDAPIVEGPPWLLDLVCERSEHVAKVRASRRQLGSGKPVELRRRWRWERPDIAPHAHFGDREQLFHSMVSARFI